MLSQNLLHILKLTDFTILLVYEIRYLLFLPSSNKTVLSKWSDIYEGIKMMNLMSFTVDNCYKNMYRYFLNGSVLLM